MRTLRFLLAATLFALVPACAQNPCDAASKCANDPKPSDAEKNRCKADLEADPCPGEADAYRSCLKAKAVCKADGTTDGQASAAACATENAAYIKCIGSADATNAK
jgi:hypothetical protein